MEDESSNCPDCQMQLLAQQSCPVPPMGHSHEKPAEEAKAVNSSCIPHIQHIISTPTSDCPDCQLQVLQQQQQCQNSLEPSPEQEGNQNQQMNLNLEGVSKSNNSFLAEMQQHIGRTPTSHWGESLMTTIPGHPRNPEEELLYGSNSRPNPSISYTATSSYNSLGVNCSSNVVALGPSTPTHSNHPPGTTPCGDLLPNATEAGCSGYCATCAVLELPTNECYYRNPLTRHTVFPPLFYNQGPTMPGFSPIPECGPWTGCNSNEFPSFSFPTAYSQQAAAISDYFSNSGVVSGHPSSVDHSNHNHTNFVDTVVSPVYQSPSLTHNIRSECPPSVAGQQKQEATHYGEKSLLNESEIVEDEEAGEEVVLPASISSDNSSSTSDSESLISQNELIVEDDDDESVSVSICNFDKNQKCVICQNPVLTDCSSPHLENILENIDDEITAEDLDITVSSADIEIGGIEDEVRCFHQKQKIGANSSPMHISLERLAQLIGVSTQDFRSEQNNLDKTDLNPMGMNSQDFSQEDVLMCYKCGKLATLADSLEKQLNNTTHILQVSYYRNVTLNFAPENRKYLENNGTTTNFKGENLGLENSQRMLNSEIYPFKDYQAAVKLNSLELEKQFVSVGTQTCISGTDSQISDNAVAKLKTSCLDISEPEHENEYSCSVCDFESMSIPSPVSINDAKSLEKFGNIIEMQNYENVDVRKFDERDSAENIHENPLKDLFSEKMSLENMDKAGEIIREDCVKEIQMERVNLQDQDHSPPIQNETEKSNRVSQILKNKNYQVSFCNLENSKYSPESQFMCDVCGKTLTTKRSLIQHLQNHETFKKQSEIKIKSQNSFSNSNSSNLVSPEESSSTALVAKSISNKEKYICLKCGLSFRGKEKMEKHSLKNCLLKTLKCEHCDRRFSKASDMQVHLRLHAGYKPFCCEVCDVSFSTKGNLVAHSRTHSATRLFRCHICEKGFNRKMALQFHVNRHTGTKPYSCTLCISSFYDPSNLINHRKKKHP